MANKKINGITIRFGADYSPLDKALKEINSTSSRRTKTGKQAVKIRPGKHGTFEPEAGIVV